jgi:hypothetical protein
MLSQAVVFGARHGAVRCHRSFARGAGHIAPPSGANRDETFRERRHNNPTSVGIEPALLYYQSDKVSMDSPETPADAFPPLQVSLELLANLIYLARRTETHSAKQHRYLDWAAVDAIAS